MRCAELKKYIYINNQVPFVLESLGCSQIKYVKDKYWTCCNADNGDNPTAVNVKDNIHLNVVNYTRDLESIDPYPDIITLVRYYHKCNLINALKWIHDLFKLPYDFTNEKATDEVDLVESYDPSTEEGCHLGFICTFFGGIDPDQNDKIPKLPDIVNNNPTILGSFDEYPHVDFTKDVCLSEETRKKFKIGYSYFYRRTTLPIFDPDGEGRLLGIRGRTSVKNYQELGIPKYYPLIAYKTSDTLYGYPELKDEINKCDAVIIFEAEKSVLKLHSLQPIFSFLTTKNLAEYKVEDEDKYNHMYGLALSGHQLSDEQVELLSRLRVKEYIFALDKDMSESISQNMCRKLSEKVTTKTISYIYDREGIMNEKDSPMDVSMSDFVRLYDTRITFQGGIL